MQPQGLALREGKELREYQSRNPTEISARALSWAQLPCPDPAPSPVLTELTQLIYSHLVYSLRSGEHQESLCPTFHPVGMSWELRDFPSPTPSFTH